MPRKNETSRIPLPLRLAAYALLVLGLLAGAAGLLELVTDGHLHENTTLHVPWGLWVAMYIFFLGLSAGAFLITTLPYLFGVRRLEPIGPLALVTSLVCLLLAGLLIMADLGHPLRMYQVMLSMNLTSPMAWMGILYSIYAVIIVSHLYLVLRPTMVARVKEGTGPTALYRLLALRSRRTDAASVAGDRRWLRRLSVMGIAVTVLVLGCEGSIFAVAKARPHWFGGLFPLVILISALASGGALMTFLTAISTRLPAEEKQGIVRWLAVFMVSILTLEMLILGTELFTAFYGGVEHELHTWEATVTGPYGLNFWGLQIGLGFMLPLLLVLSPGSRRSTTWLGLAGFLGVIGLIGTRISLVIPAQLVPVFEGFGDAYKHMRFQEGYLPSTGEWLITVGVFALGCWLLLAAFRLLPLDGSHLVAQSKGV